MLSRGSKATQAPRGIQRFRPYRNVWELGGRTFLSSRMLLNWSLPSVAFVRTWSTASWLCHGPDKAKQALPGKEIHSSVHLSVFVVVIALGSHRIVPRVSGRKVAKTIFPLSRQVGKKFPWFCSCFSHPQISPIIPEAGIRQGELPPAGSPGILRGSAVWNVRSQARLLLAKRGFR